MIIAMNIKKYRELNKLTQEELANKMKISRQSISKWERGEALPSIDNLITLSDLLDLSLDELILNKKEMPLPFDFGRIKSTFILLSWLFVPALLVVIGIIASMEELESGIFYFVAAFFLMLLIEEAGFVDLKSYYTYFTVTKTGIEYFKPKRYCPKVIRQLLALTNRRSTAFISYKDISEMQIYFNNKGFKGYNTSIAYRPRQFFIDREWLFLILVLKSGEKIELNLDRLYFPESPERHYFQSLFEFFESKNIQITDDYKVLDSVIHENDLITEAYKQLIN